MKFVTFQEKRMAYLAEGRGPVVLLVHGFGEDHRIWEDFKPDLLEEGFRVVSVDLPGFGQSDPWPDISIADMAEAVHSVVVKMKLDPFVWIGHSMGGYAGLAFAERYPEKLAGLGLFHSHPFADSEKKKAERLKSIDFINRYGHVIYLKQLLPGLFNERFIRSNAFLLDKLTYRAARFPQEGITGALRAMRNRPDRSAVLAGLSCPVLFIIGKRDTVIPEKQSLEQTHLAPAASIHILEKVGHMGMFESRKETQLIVRQFAAFCFDGIS